MKKFILSVVAASLSVGVAVAGPAAKPQLANGGHGTGVGLGSTNGSAGGQGTTAQGGTTKPTGGVNGIGQRFGNGNTTVYGSPAKPTTGANGIGQRFGNGNTTVYGYPGKPTGGTTTGTGTPKPTGGSHPKGWGGWNYKCFWSKYHCECYWCPETTCYYYWCPSASCYYPISYVQYAPPTQVQVQVSAPVTVAAPPAGIAPLPQ